MSYDMMEYVAFFTCDLRFDGHISTESGLNVISECLLLHLHCLSARPSLTEIAENVY